MDTPRCQAKPVKSLNGMPVLSVAKATDNLRRKIAKLTLAEEKAAEARREWSEALLLAQVAGVTDGNGELSVVIIAGMAGKSLPRIEQVLKAEREARGIGPIRVTKATKPNSPKEDK